MTRHTATTIRFTRRGLTLIELLVAMVVLLVGIYTVAAGFPRMLNAIRGEGDRTAMTRLAEQAMTRMADNQYGLPDAITGGGNIDPATPPDDLTAPHEAFDALQDIGEVRGETFRVPAPYNAVGVSVGAGYGYHVLDQGPAECANWGSGYPYVYMLVPLTERKDDPTAAGAVSLTSNWFHVNTHSGEVVVPTVVTTTDGTQDRRWGTGSLPGVSRIVVDYAWTFPPSGDAEPVVHHVQSEVPSDLDNSTFAGCLVAKVHPAHLPGGIVILPDQTRAWAQVDFVREPFGTQYPAGAGHYVLDNNYGVTLGFHPADVGLTVKVDYQLHTFQTTEDLDAQTAGDTVYPRRLPLMIEDQPIESARTRQDSGGVPFGETRLAVKGVDGQPLFAADLSGAALTTPVHVLAVDLQTGQTYADGLGMSLDDRTLEPPLQDGFQNGLVTYPLEISGAKAPYVGNTLRFFYRTLNRNAIQVQKAPRYYVDSDTAKAYLSGYLPGGQNEATSLAEVDYRTYQLTYVAAPSGNTYRLGVIEFGQWLTGENWSTAESSAGETVAVSYAYVRAPGEREYVWGELHTVPAGGRKFTLNHATLTGEAIEVLAVNGVSARAKAWWLNKTGRQLVLDVETVFLANPLGGVARVQ